jgi:hypothetical protein
VVPRCLSYTSVSFPSEVSYHVEGYSENVLPRDDMARVGCENFPDRDRKAAAPHLQRLCPELFRGDGLRQELEVLAAQPGRTP